MEPDYIYALVEKESRTKFYVGRSIDPDRRMGEHRYGAKNCQPDSELKYRYASALDAAGIEWEMEILMECGPDTEHFEDYFINKYRHEPLQNMRAGDDEPWMGRDYSSPTEFIQTRERLIRDQKMRNLQPKVKRESDVELTRWAGDFGEEKKISGGLQAILNRRKNDRR